MSQTSPHTTPDQATCVVEPVRRPERSRRRAGGLAAAVVVAAALSTTGCAYLSPTPITTPYNASDGINAVLNGADGLVAVRVSNLLVVGSTPGGAGEVVGTLSNESDSAVAVSLTADQGSAGPIGETRVVVPAGGVTTLGPDGGGTRLSLAVVPSGPGGILAMTVATPAIGSTPLNVPVVAPDGPYASLRPRTPTPTPTTPRPTATGAAASPSTDPAQTAEPAASATTEASPSSTAE